MLTTPCGLVGPYNYFSNQPLTIMPTMKRDAPYRVMPQDSYEDLTLLKAGSGDEFLSFQATELDLARCRKKLRLLGVTFIAQSCILLCVLGIGVALYMRRGPLNPIFPQALYCEFTLPNFLIC